MEFAQPVFLEKEVFPRYLPRRANVIWKLQDDQCFQVFIPTRYELDDILAFCDAQAVQVE